MSYDPIYVKQCVCVHVHDYMNTEENVDDTHWVVNMGYLVGSNMKK